MIITINRIYCSLGKIVYYTVLYTVWKRFSFCVHHVLSKISIWLRLSYSKGNKMIIGTSQITFLFFLTYFFLNSEIIVFPPYIQYYKMNERNYRIMFFYYSSLLSIFRFFKWLYSLSSLSICLSLFHIFSMLNMFFYYILLCKHLLFFCLFALCFYVINQLLLT